MVSATHVIMTVHPVLVLLPILGLFVLPCAPTHSVNGLTVVANQTVEKPEDCVIGLCPENKSCTKAFLYEKKSLCFLISCPNNTLNSSCGNVTNFSDLLAEQSMNTNESVQTNKNQTDELAPLNQTSVTNSSSNITQTSAPNANLSISTISTTPAVLQKNLTAATPDLQTTTTQKPATSDAVPKPTTDIAVPTPAVTFPTTPKPTTTTSPTTTSTTTTSTTVAQTTKQPSSPSPSGTNSSTDTSPSVPTTPPSIPSTKPLQTSPIPTSPVEKTSIVAPTLPKDIPKGGKAMVEVAGDPLTSHLLNTSSLLAVLLFGLLFFVVAVAVFVKQAYESYRRKDYTQVDYLINGMYADSGV